MSDVTDDVTRRGDALPCGLRAASCRHGGLVAQASEGSQAVLTLSHL